MVGARRDAPVQKQKQSTGRGDSVCPGARGADVWRGKQRIEARDEDVEPFTIPVCYSVAVRKPVSGIEEKVPKSQCPTICFDFELLILAATDGVVALHVSEA